MCNLYDHYLAYDAYVREMAAAELDLPGPQQDLPFAQVRPSEVTPVVQATAGVASLQLLPWGWPRSAGGLLLNVQSEKRRDAPAARGLTIPTAFYEYQGEKAPKAQYRFTPRGNEPVAFALVIKDGRFVLATTAPGPDVKDIHPRQPVLIPRSSWRRYLTDPIWPAELMQPTAAGLLAVERTR